jgi:hypothetical protein
MRPRAFPRRASQRTLSRAYRRHHSSLALS